MAHYLVTGGCGFIGSHLCDALLGAHHRVRVLDDLSSGLRENLDPRVELMVGSVCDVQQLRRAMDGVDGCFHLAAIASVPASQERWDEVHSVNAGGAVKVFDAARLQRIPVVYASSAAVYGDSPDMPLSEQSAPQPLTPYGVDKLACELHAQAGFRAHGLASVGLRFFNVYGARQNLDSPYSGVISIFLKRIIKGSSLLIYGDGEQSRDFVYVGDAVDSLTAAMRRMTAQTCRVYNVCTGQRTTVNRLTEILEHMTGRKAERNYKPARAGDIRLSLGNPALARAELGVALNTALDTGLRQLAEAMNLR